MHNSDSVDSGEMLSSVSFHLGVLYSAKVQVHVFPGYKKYLQHAQTIIRKLLSNSVDSDQTVPISAGTLSYQCL